MFYHLPLCLLACVVTEDRTLKLTHVMEPRPLTVGDMMEDLISALRASLQPALTPASVSPMALPGSYAGDAAGCGGFLLQVSLFLEMQPQKFTTERSKVAFLISLLSGKALFWARAMWDAQSVIINSYEAVSNHFKEVFGVAAGRLSVQDQLLNLCQRDSSLDDYTLEFRTLAGTSGWNEIALLSAYCLGLNPCIRALMAIYDDTMGLESFMQRTSRISQCLAACDEEEVTPQRASPASGPPVLAAGLCLYCASSEHLIRTCPVRPPRPAVSTLKFDAEVSTLSLLPVQLLQLQLDGKAVIQHDQWRWSQSFRFVSERASKSRLKLKAFVVHFKRLDLGPPTGGCPNQIVLVGQSPAHVFLGHTSSILPCGEQ